MAIFGGGTTTEAWRRFVWRFIENLQGGTSGQALLKNSGT